MTIAGRRELSSTCFIVSVALLGKALQIRDGFFDERALLWLSGSLALCAAGVVMLGRHRPPRQPTDTLPRVAAALAIGWHITLLLTASPGMYLDPRADLRLFRAGVIVEAALIALATFQVARVRRFWFPMLLATHFALGVWMLRASPSPHIDVVVVHREAIDALAHGRSPYAIDFENIYGPDSGFYNPTAVQGGRVAFGYPYPPLSLILAAPGQLLVGDYRYAELAAWIGAAALVGFANIGVVPKLAAALLLMQPRGFFVLEQGWTEPVSLLMLALTVFAMARKPKFAAWAGGLLIVTKQYLAIGIPLAWRFATARPRPTSFLLRVAIIAAAVTLPFALMNARAFYESVLVLQTREPFRPDSLSYLSWAARDGFGEGSFVWAIVAAAIGLAITMLVTPNSPSGFAASLALSAFLAFAFGSKAFCNYYFFVAGAMCCAIATAVDENAPA